MLHFAVVQRRDGADARTSAQFDEVYKGNRRTQAEPCALLVARRQVHRLVRPQEKASITCAMRCELLILSVQTGQATRLDLHQRGLEWVQAIDWR